jgi:hypothetical protein
MATTRVTIRKADVYKDGRKMGYFETAELTVTDNGEQQIAQEGVVGDSDGAITSELTASEIVPTDGIDSGMMDSLLDQQDVAVGYFTGGVMYNIVGRCRTGRLSTEARSGSNKGNWTIQAGKPEKA